MLYVLFARTRQTLVWLRESARSAAYASYATTRPSLPVQSACATSTQRACPRPARHSAAYGALPLPLRAVPQPRPTPSFGSHHRPQPANRRSWPRSSPISTRLSGPPLLPLHLTRPRSKRTARLLLPLTRRLCWRHGRDESGGSYFSYFSIIYFARSGRTDKVCLE